MSKHTPGPWRLRPHYKCGWKGIAKDPTPNRWQGIYEPIPGQERGAKGIVVNVGFTGGEVDDYWLSIKEADARLIEAAPELLSALKDVTRILEAVRYTAGLGKKQAERLEHARAALKKAEGLS